MTEKRCDLDTGASRVHNALKQLTLAWDEVSEQWSDESADSFAKDHLEPVVPIVKNALDAVGRMRAILHEAQRELTD